MARYRFDFAQMGCPCELVLEAADPVCAQAAARAAVAEVARLDRKYSHYRDDSYLAELEAAAGQRVVEVDDETAALLDFAAALHLESAGRFDITAGPLVRLWNPRAGRVPDRAAVERARVHVGWSRVGWRKPELELPPGMQLDLGGIVKEYAADRAADTCRAHGVTRGLVVLGGDIAIVGPRIDGSGWQVGISEPSAPARARRTVPVGHGGFATSGDYERCMVVDGRRYSHLIDIARGEPVLGYASVSVAGPSCLVAGALATMAMLAGIEDGATLLARSGMDWLALDADGAESGPLAAGRSERSS